MKVKNKNDRVLRPIYPCCGTEALYKRKMYELIDEMSASVMYWLSAAYRRNEPVLAQDAVPASELRDAIRKLVRRWQKRFNQAAPKLAKWFALSLADRSDKQLQSILRKGGFSVKFKMTRAQRDILHAAVHANVSLIKSIPQKYLNEVEGMVMRSVQTGRDLQSLQSDLLKNYKITKRRAALISRDQNNKTTAALIRVRQEELGITQAIWLHSGGGRHPRPTHVRNSGKKYDVTTGWFDPAIKKFIWPGTEINCRCVSKSIVPGFS